MGYFDSEGDWWDDSEETDLQAPVCSNCGCAAESIRYVMERHEFRYMDIMQASDGGFDMFDGDLGDVAFTDDGEWCGYACCECGNEETRVGYLVITRRAWLESIGELDDFIAEHGDGRDEPEMLVQIREGIERILMPTEPEPEEEVEAIWH